MAKRRMHIVRSHERMDYKRCMKKWYWKWRMGLVPKAISFGALDLGAWMHDALAGFYLPGRERGELAHGFVGHAQRAIEHAEALGAPQHTLDKAEELLILGEAMADAYEDKYRTDPLIDVIGAEVPLEFSIPDADGTVIAHHRLKPDLIYRERRTPDVWLMEHKTAASISTEHLVIDDQARPYGAMAERAMRSLKLISSKLVFKGVMYNFLRKGLPDQRPQDANGKYLNKNGSVSKSQPRPLFLRHPVRLTRPAKIIALKRIQSETILITGVTEAIRDGRIIPSQLTKTPHKSCPRFCQYFAMCVAEEEGGDITMMQRTMFVRQDPYTYGDSTEDPASFEMG